jgi:hypothetical protein
MAAHASTSIAFLPKKGQLQFHRIVYRLIQWFVQNDFSFDNDCILDKFNIGCKIPFFLLTILSIQNP